MLDFLLVIGVLRFFFWILALGGGLMAGMFTGAVARAHLAYHGIINYERRNYYIEQYHRYQSSQLLPSQKDFKHYRTYADFKENGPISRLPSLEQPKPEPPKVESDEVREMRRELEVLRAQAKAREMERRLKKLPPEAPAPR